jgi:hypothetical protein
MLTHIDCQAAHCFISGIALHKSEYVANKSHSLMLPISQRFAIRDFTCAFGATGHRHLIANRSDV